MVGGHVDSDENSFPLHSSFSLFSNSFLIFAPPLFADFVLSSPLVLTFYSIYCSYKLAILVHMDTLIDTIVQEFVDILRCSLFFFW